ncbi:hypothetical protein [Bacillus pseudomycoides]|uniref:hypothetical protein n=1 Tax=Bacillus pseudomycoides TaxID=64104 RepID=UPI000BF230D1|nr:hypothetical protein [Bacillus pseudomycoides]PEK60773.1 hypothetical protein CN593_27835 [Bacillus pseudomycoides]PFY53599.1 hypothetical protein COL49_25930 [Bacillus pseudomycoides]PGE20456.1 hypothetical protein COM57_29505 [Bacillus pseudomycoides]
MGLIFKNAVEKADNIIEKYEGKRKELQDKLVKLNDDSRFLQSELENDFQRAIMEDGTPNEKLKTDLNKVHAEREQVQKMLGNMDNLLQNTLEGIREEVEADRDKVFAGIRKQEEAMEKEIKDAKLQYLQLLVKQNELIMQGSRELGGFHDIESRLGMKPIDIRSRRLVGFDMAQTFYRGFHPIVTVEDVRKAYFGELEYHAKQYAEQKK